MTAAANGGGRSARGAGALFALVLCLYLLGGHGHIENPDAEVSYQTARALVERGDPALVPEAGPVVRLILAAEGGQAYGAARGRDGRFYSWFGIGHALWEAPFLLAGKGLAALLPGVEAAAAAGPWPLAEYGGGVDLRLEEYFPRALASLSHPLAGALACLVLLSLARLLGLKPGAALLAVAVQAVATMAWPFSRESLSDGPAALLAWLALRDAVAWSRGAGGRWTLARAGLWAGLMVSVRVMLVLGLAPLGAYLLLGLRRRPGAGWREALAFAAPLAAVGAALMAFNAWRFGDPLDTGYNEQVDPAFFSHPILWGLLVLLLSAGKGLLPFNPPLLGLLGLRGARVPRAEAWLFLGLLLALLLPCAAAAGGHGSWCWGPRYLLPALAPLILLTGFVWEAGGWRRLLAAATALLGLATALGGVASPVHGWWAASFAAARRAHPDRLDLTNLVFAGPRWSPLPGSWRYLEANLRGRLVPGGTPGLAREWFGLEGTAGEEPLPPRSVQLQGFRHLWWVDLGARLGRPWLAALLCLPLLLGAGASLGRLLRSMGDLKRAGTEP